MNALEIVAFSLGVSLDAMAAAIAMGSAGSEKNGPNAPSSTPTGDALGEPEESASRVAPAAHGSTSFGAPAALRLSALFGFFQFAMPMIGARVAGLIPASLEAAGPWIAGAVLVVIGFPMAFPRGGGGDDEREAKDAGPRTWRRDLALAAATSFDALAVGASIGLRGATVTEVAIAMGLLTATLSLVGFRLGAHLHKSFGTIATRIGGFVLMGLGLSAPFL